MYTSAPSSFDSCQAAADFASGNPATCVPACPVCVSASVKDASQPCSRRCQWAGSGACAQCGRWLAPGDAGSTLPFCGPACHSQAHHANWCSGCGVRQRGYGAQSCGAVFCEAVAPSRTAGVSGPKSGRGVRRAAPPQVAAGHIVNPSMWPAAVGDLGHHALAMAPFAGMMMPPDSDWSLAGGAGYVDSSMVPAPWGAVWQPTFPQAPMVATVGVGFNSVVATPSHAARRTTSAPPLFEILPPHDKHRQALEGMIRPHGFTPVAVVRLIAHASAKKNYLAYRARVESEIGAFKEAKYGFGGEGNEQRRFTPLASSCGAERLARLVTRRSSDPIEEPCHDPACDVCRTLRLGGAKLSSMSAVASHYSITGIDVALGAAASLISPSSCEPNAAVPSSSLPLLAIMVSRVVVGRPVIVQDITEMGLTLPPLQHSFVVSDGNSRRDGVYVLSDDAVDACHVVFACPS